MTPEEIIKRLRGLIEFADETRRAAGLAGIFPSPEHRALSRIGDGLEEIVTALETEQ